MPQCCSWAHYGKYRLVDFVLCQRNEITVVQNSCPIRLFTRKYNQARAYLLLALWTCYECSADIYYAFQANLAFAKFTYANLHTSTLCLGDIVGSAYCLLHSERKRTLYIAMTKQTAIVLRMLSMFPTFMKLTDNEAN